MNGPIICHLFIIPCNIYKRIIFKNAIESRSKIVKVILRAGCTQTFFCDGTLAVSTIFAKLSPCCVYMHV